MKKDENLRLAFDRLDADDKGKITLDNLLEFMGANSDELTIGEEITDETLHEALIGEDGDGLSYDVVRKCLAVGVLVWSWIVVCLLNAVVNFAFFSVSILSVVVAGVAEVP